MQIECNAVIQAEVIIVNRAVVDHAETEGDDLSILAPEKETGAFWHFLPQPAEIFPGQSLEFEGRPVVNLKVKWIDLFDKGRDIVQHFTFNRGRLFGLPEFPSRAETRRYARDPRIPPLPLAAAATFAENAGVRDRLLARWGCYGTNGPLLDH
jgi:hypothetical protein